MKATRRVAYALLLTVIGGLAACDTHEGIEQVSGPAVQYSKGDKKNVELLRRANRLSGDVTYVTQSPVTKKGAVLTFGGHSLVIERNAVKGPTYFSATLRAGDELVVDLRAWEPEGTAVTHFDRPLDFTLDISDAVNANVTNLHTLTVYYLAPNGTYERIPSIVNPAQRTLTGKLTHFSDYSGGFPRNPSPEP